MGVNEGTGKRDDRVGVLLTILMGTVIEVAMVTVVVVVMEVARVSIVMVMDVHDGGGSDGDSETGRGGGDGGDGVHDGAEIGNAGFSGVGDNISGGIDDASGKGSAEL